MSVAGLGREPSRLPRADLAAAFGPPDRAATLTGRLRPAPAPATPAEPAPTRATKSGPSSSPRTDPAEQLPRPEEASRKATDSAPPLVVIAYLPASLRDRLREAATSRSVTYTTVVLEALDATHERLDTLLSGQGPTHRPGSLFSGGSGRARPRNVEPHVQVSVRLTRSDLSVIDQLASDHGADNRSALIATALTAHLTGTQL